MLLESPFLEVELGLGEAESEPALDGEDSYARPKDWPKLDSDAVLVASLRKLKTRAAHLLELALLAKPEDFEKRLVAALAGTPWSSEKGSLALQRVLARLGAQAFVLGVDVPEANRVQVGFVNHPSRLTDSPSPGGRIDFLHYACERLRRRSFKASSVAEHERQLSCAAALFAWFQRELGRDYSLVALEKSMLLGYRRLCVALAHKHHQALLEHWLDQARRSRALAEQALTALQRALELLVVTQVGDDDARLLSFNLDSKVFHDYFTPKAASDFPYSYFSAKAKASTQKPFETGFSALLRRRADQLAYLRDLLRASGSDAPPSLFRTEAWQSFLLARWGSNWKALPLAERLRCALRFVERYFQLFTLHVPHNLREGCGEPSYLTRSFPRAVNGGRIHDCAVYAARWLHMLGALIDPKLPAADITSSRIWLVEMPVHVGVMIRLNPTPKRELLLSINNAEATLHDIDPTLKDELAAGKVIEDVFHGAPTPFLLHPVKASLTDGKALWRELCSRFEKRTVLPYKDANEPHLRYLEYKAELAKVANRLSTALYALWNVLSQELEKKPSSADKAKLIAAYKAGFEAARKVAVTEYDALKPLLDGIGTDLKDHASQLPKSSQLAPAPSSLPPPWWEQGRAYLAELERAAKTLDVSGLHPSAFFPEDDFIAAID